MHFLIEDIEREYYNGDSACSEGTSNTELKLYKNLNPEDVRPWNGKQWNLQKIDGKFKDISNGWTADGEYVYVITKDNKV